MYFLTITQKFTINRLKNDSTKKNNELQNVAWSNQEVTKKKEIKIVFTPQNNNTDSIFNGIQINPTGSIPYPEEMKDKLDTEYETETYSEWVDDWKYR